MVLSILEQASLLTPFCLAIFLLFRIFKITDLSLEASFVFGAAVYAKVFLFTQSNLVAVACALTCGFVVGAVNALVQIKKNLSPLICGVLMLFIVNSLTFIIMDRPFISLHNHSTIFTLISQHGEGFASLSTIIISLALLAVFIVFFSTKIGLLCRAAATNFILFKRLGFCGDFYKTVALGFSGALAALSGLLFATRGGFVDLHMGAGLSVVGIGSVVLGVELFKFIRKSESFNPFFDVCSVFAGLLFYFTAMHVLLFFGLSPIFIKLMLGVFLLIVLGKGFSDE